MAKKKEVELEEVKSVEAIVYEPKKKVEQFDLSFPNEDLNQLVKKVKEIIDFVN